MTVLFAQARFCAGCSADLFALGWRLYVAWLGEQRRMGDALTQNSYCVCVCACMCLSVCVPAYAFAVLAPAHFLAVGCNVFLLQAPGSVCDVGDA